MVAMGPLGGLRVVPSAPGRRYLYQPPNKGRWARAWRAWTGATPASGLGYDHVVQLGDPVLRQPAQLLNPADLDTPAIQGLIERMTRLLARFDGLGLSAPQLGVPVRISVVQFTAAQVKQWQPDYVAEHGLAEVPLRVLVNPSLRITHNTTLWAREGCTSMLGYSALVPRAQGVTVSAWDQHGQAFEWPVRDWTARLVQHEVDHLDGRLFLDRMKPESLVFNYWPTVNRRGGDFKLTFDGVKSTHNPLVPFIRHNASVD